MLTDHTIETPGGKLFYEGNVEPLVSMEERRVAVIGTRAPSDVIRKNTVDLVEYLVHNDVVIVSGLALGVDTLAHGTAVEKGGTTIAIPGSPLNNIYPARNKGLAEEILASGGCLASPFAPGTGINKGMFPQRNRVIAAVCHAVVITGIAPVSGTFHVVWEAQMRGIPVFAIPADPESLLYGANILIKARHATALTDWGQAIEGAEAFWRTTRKTQGETV